MTFLKILSNKYKYLMIENGTRHSDLLFWDCMILKRKKLLMIMDPDITVFLVLVSNLGLH